MFEGEKIIREIYTSDTILMDEEIEMMQNVDDTYFDKMEELISRLHDHQLILTEDEFNDLQNRFNEFYFEYAFVQFKRGLELGLSLRRIYEKKGDSCGL